MGGVSVTDVDARLMSGLRSEPTAVHSKSGSNANDQHAWAADNAFPL
jgi:hypothetical protein